MKTCFKCGVEKPLSEFYRHNQMADGRLNKCCACTKNDVAMHRRANLEKLREYDRRRAREPHRRDLTARVSKRWAMLFPEHRRAQVIAGNAQRAGKLARSTVCQDCGQSAGRIEKHHPDYSQPLLVVWLCKPCHAAADKARRQAEAE